MLPSSSIAVNWYLTAKQNDMPEPEAAFKFMAYWMAFNSLYSRDRDGNLQEISERKAISQFINNKSNLRTMRDGFNPLRHKKLDVLYERPVLSTALIRSSDDTIREIANMSHDSNYYLNCVYPEPHREDRGFKRKNELYTALSCYQNLMNTKDEYTEDTVYALIMTVYKIRCNLFHGDKEPHPNDMDRDTRLVNAAAFIMEGYMKALLKNEESYKVAVEYDNNITNKIIARKYKYENHSEWGGADLIIAPIKTKEIEKWLADSSIHKTIITDHSSALIWLINKLKPTVNSKFDYITKYDFYSTFADKANYILDKTSNDVDVTTILTYIYNELRNIYHKEFKSLS